METALTYTLQRVHWQFFGTLTFKRAKVPERVRVSMFFALGDECFHNFFPSALCQCRVACG